MRWVRFLHAGRIHEGRVTEEGVLLDEGGHRVPEAEVTWLPPVEAGTVIGLALNYADHARELGLDLPREPVLFIKPPTALTGHRSPIIYPSGAQYMHYEAELAVVIGRTGRCIRREEAMEYVRGYTIANDVTVRDFVGNMYRPPIRAKGFDTFGPMGPYLVDRDDIADPHSLAVRTYVNGVLRQSGNTRDLIFQIETLIEFISSFMTLRPGDVLWTGTPRGISPVKPGDVIAIEIEGLGRLENPVIAEEGGR